VLAEGGAGDDPEAVLRQPGDREVALDAAALVEHLRVSQRTDASGDAVVRQALEKRRRTAPANLDLGEGCEVEERGSLAAGSVFRVFGRGSFWE
jgi:hypothetical protein